MQSVPYGFDRYFGGEPLCRPLPLAPDERKIGVGKLGQKPRRRMVRLDIEVKRLAHRLRSRIGVGEHEAGEPPGERRLADSLPAADQPGVGEAPLAIGRKHFRFGALMTDQRIDMARMGRAGQRVGFGKIVGLALLHARLAHARLALSAPMGSSRVSTADQMAAPTSCSLLSASMTMQR